MCYSEDVWPKDGQRCVFEHHWGKEITEFFNDGKLCWGYELIDVDLLPGYEFVEDDELTALLLKLKWFDMEEFGLFKLENFDYFVTREGRDLWQELGIEKTTS